MTPNDVFTEVRKLINDVDATTYRNSDTDLVGYLNQVLQLMLQLRPDLFSFIGEFTCVAGILQTLPSNGYRMMEVFGSKNGNAITEADREALDQAMPSWRVASSGTLVNWFRHPRSMTQFFLYPPPMGGEIVILEYVKSPITYTGADLGNSITELGDSYLPTLVNGIVWLVESMDDEHVASGRAQQFQQAFMSNLGQAQQAKMISDTEAGAVIEAPVRQ